MSGFQQSPLEKGSNRDADGVTDQVGPEEPGAQHQPAQRGLPDRIDPRGVIELAELYGEGQAKRDRSPGRDRAPGQHRTHKQE